MKTNLIKKIVYGLTVGCIFLSFGAFAMANEAPNDPMMRRPDIPPQEDIHNPRDMESHISKSLDKLVNEGTITKDQSDKVLQFFQEKNSQRKAEMDKIKDMSPEDREIYFKQNFHKRPDLIAELKNVTDLSDEQAKAIAEAVRPPHRPNPNGPACPMMSHP